MKNTMNSLQVFIAMGIILTLTAMAFADTSLQSEEIQNAPEAQLVIRYGDIDNLGFGFPEGYDLFSGESTPAHRYPWEIDPADALGTDRIMVVSSYEGSPPAGTDGYTNSTNRPDNDPLVMELTFTPPDFSINDVIFQIFVDDFQATRFASVYQIWINDMRFTELEDIINSMDQVGPIGKLLSIKLPPRMLSSLGDGHFKLFIDDPITGAGDGFAVDFFRLLINPGQFANTGIVNGHVYDEATSTPIKGAFVSAAGLGSAETDADGYYEIADVPAGLAALTAEAQGYAPLTLNQDLIADQTATLDFHLKVTEEPGCDCQDADQDGVPDAWDHCPETPEGSFVDRHGCRGQIKDENDNEPNDNGLTEEDLETAWNNGYKEGYAEALNQYNPDHECNAAGNCWPDDGTPTEWNGDNVGPQECFDPATLSPELNLFIPHINYETLFGPVSLWMEMQYIPTDDGRFIFELMNFDMQ